MNYSQSHFRERFQTVRARNHVRKEDLAFMFKRAFCDPLALQNRYADFEFLNGLGSVAHRDVEIMRYALSCWRDVIEIWSELLYLKPYVCRLMLDSDSEMFWPELFFANFDFIMLSKPRRRPVPSSDFAFRVRAALNVVPGAGNLPVIVEEKCQDPECFKSYVDFEPASTESRLLITQCGVKDSRVGS